MKTKTNNENIIKLIRNFERRHKKIYRFDGDYSTDCQIKDNFISRVAPRKEWLGDDESWERSKKEEADRDELIRCPTCEFIKELKSEVLK